MSTASEAQGPDGEPLPTRRPPANAWSRGVLGWHLAFWLLWALSVVAALLWSPDEDVLGPRWMSLSLLAIIGVAYLVLGQPAARNEDRRGARAYLVITVVTLSALFAVSPGLSFLLFLAFPQMWFLTSSRREGTGFTIALAAGSATGLTLHGGTLADAGTSFLSLGVSLVFSVVLGLWITGIVEQSEERAGLIAQLEATRADLSRAHHEAGVVAERERLAREIHDTIAQGLTSVVMMSQVASRELAAGRAEAAAAKLSTIEEAARHNLADARALVASHAAVGVEEDLRAVLGRLATRFTAETGIPVGVCVPTDTGGFRAPASHQVVLLRSVQEGLANVRKHAAASRVELRLDRGSQGCLAVEIRDNGAGFDPTADARGFGLRGLARRAREVGGTLAVTSRPGDGTLVRVAVPGDD